MAFLNNRIFARPGLDSKPAQLMFLKYVSTDVNGLETVSIKLNDTRIGQPVAEITCNIRCCADYNNLNRHPSQSRSCCTFLA
eukprot:scaffold207799_cov22-Prasinocladus_malaysianus.AAC.1